MRLRPPWQASAILLVGLLANIFVFVTVNFWIYRARYLFGIRNPDYVARKSATISQSISDPSVGQPFAFWISLSAVILIFAVGAVVWLHLRAARQLRARLAKFFYIALVFAGFVGLSQIAAAAGMITLSQFRFPHFNHIHMMGSYVFFVFQALTVAFSALVCYWLAHSAGADDGLAGGPSLRPKMNALRWRFGVLSVLSTLAYVLLFYAKDHAPEGLRPAIYATYVMLEPAVITGFLVYLLSFCVDLWLAAIPWRGPVMSAQRRADTAPPAPRVAAQLRVPKRRKRQGPSA